MELSQKNCGSSNKVRVKLKQGGKRSCQTEKLDNFSPGDKLTWTRDNLGDCKHIEFDEEKLKLSFWIESYKKNHNFCVESVTVILNDDQNSTFFKKIRGDRSYSKRRNKKEHKANKITAR